MNKYITIIFLIVFRVVTAQTDSIPPKNLSVISAEKMNVVYRGIDNPIKIAVPEAVSFTATAPGMRLDSIKGPGNYILNPGPGNELTVNVIAKMPDGVSKTEKKIFRIQGIPAPVGTIKGNSPKDSPLFMTKEEIKNGIVEINMPNFLFDFEMSVTQFSIKIAKYETFIISGNRINDKAKLLIDKTKKGKIILISEIKYSHSPEALLKSVRPIVIELID